MRARPATTLQRGGPGTAAAEVEVEDGVPVVAAVALGEAIGAMMIRRRHTSQVAAAHLRGLAGNLGSFRALQLVLPPAITREAAPTDNSSSNKMAVAVGLAVAARPLLQTTTILARAVVLVMRALALVARADDESLLYTWPKCRIEIESYHSGYNAIGLGHKFKQDCFKANHEVLRHSCYSIPSQIPISHDSPQLFKLHM